MDWSQNHARLFRCLLYCYPAEFRHEYGGEMERMFADRLETEPAWRLWMESVADVAWTAPGEWWHTLLSDVRFGTRVLLTTPGFSLLAILVMALGIAATTAVFSLVNAVLLRSLPYANPEELVYVWSPNVNLKGIPDELGPNVPDFYDWQRTSKSFSSMAAFELRGINFVRNGATTPIGSAFVTGTFFETLKIQPLLGRVLNSNDDRPGQSRVAVVSETFWQTALGGTPEPLGKQVQFNRERYTIVGIMPRDFGYPYDGDIPYEHPEFLKTDVWLPAAYTADQRSNRVNFVSSNVIGRLRNGIPPAAAQAELIAIERQLQKLYPPMWRGWTVKVGSLVETILGPVETMLWLLFGAVAAVLLISISNVANLLLARSVARAQEMGIRAALGAEPMRIVRQLLTESLILSLTAGALGILLAYGSIHLLRRVNPGGIPRFDSANVDGRVLLAALALSLGGGILAGIAPALFASRADMNDLLKRGGTRLPGAANQSRFALIMVEVALSMVLLTGAGLALRSYLRRVAVAPGFSRTTVTFSVKLDEHYAKPETRAAFLREFLRQLQNLPGVQAAGASNALPLSRHESVTGAEIRGFGQSKEMVENRSVTPAYRRALGMRLLRGRDFNLQDAARPNVVMVNRAFVNEYFKGREPIGGQLRIGIGDLGKTPWSTIIGVVDDVRHNALEEMPKPQILQPVDNSDDFAIASGLPPGLILEQARLKLHDLDAALALDKPATMEQRIGDSNHRRTFQTSLLLGFAAIAAALVLGGLYGLIAYSVKTRTAEIGLRLALGSSRGRIAWLILRQGLCVTLLGLFIGLVLSLALLRMISTWLFDITPSDPLTLSAVALLLLAIAALACVFPALTATRIEPASALKIE